MGWGRYFWLYLTSPRDDIQVFPYNASLHFKLYECLGYLMQYNTEKKWKYLNECFSTSSLQLGQIDHKKKNVCFQ